MLQKTSGRLLALDVLRGLTIAGMLMVNNPGSWSFIYKPLRHAYWNGLTPTDLVFPFFMFIMGISTYISLRKSNFEYRPSVLFKILKRTVVIFLIGLGLAWISLSFRTFNSLSNSDFGGLERFFKAITNFENLRIMGVMQRLAITYGVTSLIAIFVKHKYIPYIIVTSLIGYVALLLMYDGYELSETSIVSVVDRAILGANHMYRHGGVILDPEGLFSTVPAVCHVLIGFLCGKSLMATKDNQKRISHLFIVGSILTFIGFLMDYGLPINKTIWSPTYVLVTCGMAATLLALLIWIIDIKGHKRWSVFFESFGVNPLFIYVLGTLLSIVLAYTQFTYNGAVISVKSYFYKELLHPILGDYSASLAFSILYILILWMISNILYKKQIYIKI